MARERRALADERDWVRSCWYGMGGAGKTTDLAALAHRGKVVWIDAEPGIKKVALKQRGIPAENIELGLAPGRGITLDSLGAVPDHVGKGLFWDLREELYTEGNPNGVVGIGLDSANATQSALNSIIQAKEMVRAEKKAEKDRVDNEREFFDFYRDDWGVSTNQLRQIWEKYITLPVHFGVTASIASRQWSTDNKIHTAPGLSQAAARDLIGYMDIVLHTEIISLPGWENDGNAYVGRSISYGLYECKDRFGMLPRTMINPTFDRVIAYVHEEISVEDDPLQQRFQEMYIKMRETETAAKAAKQVGRRPAA